MNHKERAEERRHRQQIMETTDVYVSLEIATTFGAEQIKKAVDQARDLYIWHGEIIGEIMDQREGRSTLCHYAVSVNNTEGNYFMLLA